MPLVPPLGPGICRAARANPAAGCWKNGCALRALDMGFHPQPTGKCRPNRAEGNLRERKGKTDQEGNFSMKAKVRETHSLTLG